MHPDADSLATAISPEADTTVAAEPVVGEPEPPRSRRAILAGALGALIGGVAGALGRPAEVRAAPGDPLIIGTTNFGGGSGTRLNATSSGGALWVTQYGFGSGVRGDSVSGHGGVFATQHANRYGVYAQQTGGIGTGAAVFGAGGTNIGVYGASTASVGVQGLSNSSYGVYGGGGAVGVRGDGTSYGVEGVSSANGVRGFSDGGNGVRGGAAGGLGVLGEATSGVGVYGYSDTGSAGYFEGDVTVLGTLSKAGGSFQIDHPLDPESKLLQHSFVESPDMLNVYDGIVAAGPNGEATVEMPAWFDALNTDIRYQLTPIGSFAPLYVKSKVNKGRFTVAGAAPGQEVSWQLTGIRRDAWAEAHRIEVELEKTSDQKGRYLHPLEHGQPASKGVTRR